MRTIAHLSDLHFGRIDPVTLEPLVNAMQKLQPDLVAISGDLTQRARTSQFVAARDFLARLPTPQLIVPGNHDVPLHNVFRRFYQPLRNYRRYICEDLQPVFTDEEITVVGVNTARSLTWKEGRISHEQIEAVRARLCETDDGKIKVVVTHHPFDLPPHAADQQIVGRAALAMSQLAECGVDLLLAGHIHLGHIGETSMRYKIPGHAAIIVQAGTTTSTRGRGEPNSYNVIRIEQERIELTRWQWKAEQNYFAELLTEIYLCTGGVWQKS